MVHSLHRVCAGAATRIPITKPFTCTYPTDTFCTGYLFLLPDGIVWGFKKPLAFFPFHAITSISYTSVLQRTFNLNITTTSSTSSSPNSNTETATTEIEFSMIDQADFAGIDAYIRRHGLHDASMAEQRRAKRLNVNGVNSKGGEGYDDTAENSDGEGELQKAAREADEMEDEEEEEDENFDPGSEGE
ncbi:MAG: hypothetical protein LQ348_006546, partial [Seirophora lacunosa]